MGVFLVTVGVGKLQVLNHSGADALKMLLIGLATKIGCSASPVERCYVRAIHTSVIHHQAEPARSRNQPAFNENPSD